MSSIHKYCKSGIFIFSFFISFTCYAQLDTLYFSQSFIKNNKIAQLTIEQKKKKDNERILPGKYSYVYQFDTLGRVIKKLVIDLNFGLLPADTFITLYGFQNSNNLFYTRNVAKGTMDEFTTKYRVKHPKYSFEQIIVKEKISYTNNLPTIVYQVPIDSEFVSQVNYESQCIQTYFNNLKLPFAKILESRSDTLYSFEKKYFTTGVFEKYEIKYLNKNIQSVKTSSNINGYDEFVYLYNYQTNSSIITSQIGLLNKKVKFEYFWYYSSSKLLESILIKQIDSNNFDFLVFTYRFY